MSEVVSDGRCPKLLIRYRTQEDAHEHAERLGRGEYRCDTCGDWHVADRLCLCGCGASMEGHRADALYRLESCRHRHRPPDPYSRLNHAEREMAAVLGADPCSYCGRRGNYRADQVSGSGMGADHIVARHNGGDRDWTNLTAACAACNSSKYTDSLLHFLLRRAA